MTAPLARVPCTIVTGFLGSGKTTLIRHVLANANGRRLAVIVNEFGDVGIDGEILKGCGDAACLEENIVELASKEPGVQKLENKVEVLPVSPEDERLRNQLATEIYQEFPDYAQQSSPPIHIIVENSRVTLFGIVRNQVERHQILNIARSAFGVLDVEDKLTIGESET